MDHNRRRAAWVVLAVVVLQLSMTSAVHAAPRDATVSAPTVEEPPATHLLSVALGLGLAFGGDELPNRGMNAGEGVSASVGAASAPFWVSWLGFGAGIDFGFKHASARAARADYALARWPLALHADVLARVSPQIGRAHV